MKETVLTFAALLGGLAVIFGAFGAHALKKRMNEDILRSFETGVKYQMYHSLALLGVAQQLTFETFLEKGVAYCFISGTLLFSFSIYGLCLTTTFGNKWRFLGPITPLGGLLLVLGWLSFLISL